MFLCSRDRRIERGSTPVSSRDELHGFKHVRNLANLTNKEYCSRELESRNRHAFERRDFSFRADESDIDVINFVEVSQINYGSEHALRCVGKSMNFDSARGRIFSEPARDWDNRYFFKLLCEMNPARFESFGKLFIPVKSNCPELLQEHLRENNNQRAIRAGRTCAR